MFYLLHGEFASAIFLLRVGPTIELGIPLLVFYLFILTQESFPYRTSES